MQSSSRDRTARGLKAHSSVATSALQALEQRDSALRATRTLELEPPPQPVPRRKRPFIRPIAPVHLPAIKPEPQIVLDGFVMLEAARVEDPVEADRVVLEGCGISAVVEEDLAYFTKLTHLDLGDNQVQLATLAFMPALQELHLDCNGLVNLVCPDGGFPKLEVLNLSFNGLAPQALLALAQLPMLRELDVSMNKLSSLPSDLSSLASLERLNADKNLLGTEAHFLSLATLPQLRALSLADNRISELYASATERGFAQLASLSLANNQIAEEAALLPLLHLEALSTLLLYGNPFLHHGKASKEFVEVLQTQRGVALGTTPPPPPPPPKKVDVRALASVAEPPTRRLISLEQTRRARKERVSSPAALSSPAAAPAATDADAGPSFFLTSVAHEADAQADAQANAQADDDDDEPDTSWEALADELASTPVDNVDIRVAVNALKKALERPDEDPLPPSTSFLKETGASIARSRQKHVFDKQETAARSTPAQESSACERLARMQKRLSQLESSAEADGHISPLAALEAMRLDNTAPPPLA